MVAAMRAASIPTKPNGNTLYTIPKKTDPRAGIYLRKRAQLTNLASTLWRQAVECQQRKCQKQNGSHSADLHNRLLIRH